MDLYSRIKSHHIQQDRSDGCSLASTLMVINAIQGSSITQQELRDILKNSKITALKNWRYRVSGYRKGIRIDMLYKCIKLLFDHMGIKAEIIKTPLRPLRKAQFESLLSDVCQSPNRYLIFNYSAHYSPLGSYHGQTMKILDVDWEEKYDREFHYGPGEGEDERNVYAFLKRYKRTRSMLLIES